MLMRKYHLPNTYKYKLNINYIDIKYYQYNLIKKLSFAEVITNIKII